MRYDQPEPEGEPVPSTYVISDDDGMLIGLPTFPEAIQFAVHHVRFMAAHGFPVKYARISWEGPVGEQCLYVSKRHDGTTALYRVY